MVEFRKKNYFLYLIFSYENSATHQQLSLKKSKVFIGGTIFIWKYEIYNENLFFWKFSYMTLFGRISKCGDNGPV